MPSNNKKTDVHIYICIVLTDGKYHMLPTGELLVRRVDDADKYRSYQCRAMNRLNAKTLLSVGRARLSVTGMNYIFSK